MHLSVRERSLAIALCCLYLPAMVRGLPYNELVVRAEVVDLDPTVDDTAGADDDGTTAATGTQDTSSDTSTGKLAQQYDMLSSLTIHLRIRLALARHPRLRRTQRDK